LLSATRPIRLSFQFCNLSNTGSDALADAVAQCHSLTFLLVCNNPYISLAGYETLKQAVVSSPSTIEELRLLDETKSPKLDQKMTPRDLRHEGIKPLVTNADPSVIKLISALKSLGFEDTNASKLSRNLVMNGVTTFERMMHANDFVLDKCGFSAGDITDFYMGKALLSAPPISSTTTDVVAKIVEEGPMGTNLIFFSYVKKDTVAEAGVIFAAAKQNFPKYKIFLDTQEHLHLGNLVANVKKSKNILIFLSPNYTSSPYCLVELCTAVQCGAKISTVLVHKPGLGQFNFEQMNALLKSGDVSALLDEGGWSLVKEQGITKDMIISAMKAVINVKAFPFHVDASERSKNAQLEDIWDGIML